MVLNTLKLTTYSMFPWWCSDLRCVPVEGLEVLVSDHCLSVGTLHHTPNTRVPCNEIRKHLKTFRIDGERE